MTFVMQENLQALWKAVLGEIEIGISRANFLTLFKNTALISLEDSHATIAAPSKMIIDLLQKRYVDIIKTTLDKHTKLDTIISFTPKAIATTSKTADIDTPLFPEEKPKPIGHLPRVRSDFIFETLAVSDSNRLAFESARTVVKNLGRSYNPLFIYGPVGVGKTHIMQAIANAVYTQSPDNKIIYITSEEFTNEVVEAIRSNDTARMKRKFRSVQLLIIDDVQFIAGKDRVQEELFHTFNTLIDGGGQIVLSSDRPPSEIKKLEARLSSRFAGGLTVDIEKPDFETRTAIVMKKGEKFGVVIPVEVAKIIAEEEQDVRSLEGTLLRIITSAGTSREITASLVEKSLHNDRPKEVHVLHAEDIIKSTCEFYGVKSTQLKGPKRDASLVKARQVAMYLLKTELGMTLVEIGNALGGRDHTTVMYGVGKMELLVENRHRVGEEILGITKVLRG